jgi:hypothetical protein
MEATKASQKPSSPSTILAIPELEHAKAAAVGTLVSLHSRRAYKHAIDKFIAWYCSGPRFGFNRTVVLRYRSFLGSLSLSAATINLHLSAIRRLADEAGLWGVGLAHSQVSVSLCCCKRTASAAFSAMSGLSVSSRTIASSSISSLSAESSMPR